MKGFILVLVLFALFSRGFSMTLEEVIELAVKNSKPLLSARRETEAAKLELSAQRQSFLPTLFLSYGGTIQAQPQEFELGFLGFEDFQTSRRTFQNLRFGARFQLFDGGLRNSLTEAATYSLSISKLQEVEKEQSIKLEAALAFFDALSTKELVEVQKKQLESINAILTQREAFFKAGLITVTEVLQARVRQSEALRELQRAEGQLRISLENLKRLTGREVKDLNPPEMMPEPEPLERSLIKAQKRASLKIIEEQAKLLRAQRKAQISAIYPQINLEALYIYSDQNLAIKPRGNFQAGITLDFSIRGLEAIKRASAISERERAVLANLEEQRELIRLEILKAYEDYKVSLENLKVARDNLKYAQELFRLSQKQYENQIITGLELLEAEASLTQARKAEIVAKYDLFKSILRIKRQVGEL
ncbi:MAG: TolC family protein [Aquificaceae bacterium]